MDIMKLPEEIIKLLNNSAVSVTMTTVNSEGELHAAPVTVMPSTDGEKILFGQIWAVKTPSNLEWMLSSEKDPIMVIQFVQYVSHRALEGYSLRLKILQKITSGPLFDEDKEILFRRFGKTPEAIWEFSPIEYKNHGFKH